MPWSRQRIEGWNAKEGAWRHYLHCAAGCDAEPARVWGYFACLHALRVYLRAERAFFLTSMQEAAQTDPALASLCRDLTWRVRPVFDDCMQLAERLEARVLRSEFPQDHRDIMEHTVRVVGRLCETIIESWSAIRQLRDEKSPHPMSE